MSKLGNERLLKLADYLETQYVEPNTNWNKFGMSTFVHCALGRCPTVFPEHWHIPRDTAPELIISKNNLSFTDARKFFDISHEACMHLFSGAYKDFRINIYGGLRPERASDLAYNIREYVRRSTGFWNRFKLNLRAIWG